MGIFDFFSGKKKEKEQLEEEQLRKQAFSNFQTAVSCHVLSDAQAIGASLNSIVGAGLYDNIMMCLDRLSLPAGYKLKIRFPRDNGYGDLSRLYIKKPWGVIIKDVFSVITVEESAIGALQVYLLDKVWHYLPMFWHGNYCRRTYVYSQKELYKIEEIHYSDKIGEYDVNPCVSEKGGKYYISCCYWSSFEGLVREVVEIEIKGGKVADVLDINEQVLYKYNCGICY